MTHSEKVGARIKELREAKGLTGEGLGKHLGLSKSQVSVIEKGKTRLNTDQLLILVQLFGVSSSYIMCENSPLDGGAFGKSETDKILKEKDDEIIRLKAKLYDAGDKPNFSKPFSKTASGYSLDYAFFSKRGTDSGTGTRQYA